MILPRRLLSVLLVLACVSIGDTQGPGHGSAHISTEDRVSELEAKARAIDTRWVGHAREHELLQLAIDKAEGAMLVRLEGMNEFRSQLNRQQDTFVTKDLLEQTVAPIRQFQDRFWGIVVGVSALNAVITALAVLLVQSRMKKS